MGIISADTIDFLFSSTTTTSQAQLDSLADTALGQGIDSYQKGDYDRAISSFKRSAGLSPFSDNSAKAYDYMAKAYLAQDKVDEAIKTYEDAIKIYEEWIKNQTEDSPYGYYNVEYGLHFID